MSFHTDEGVTFERLRVGSTASDSPPSLHCQIHWHSGDTQRIKMWEAIVFTLLSIIGTIIFFTLFKGNKSDETLTAETPLSKPGTESESVRSEEKGSAEVQQEPSQAEQIETLKQAQNIDEYEQDEDEEKKQEPVDLEADLAKENERLPPGWTVAYSRTHSKKYYWHAASSTNQWFPPGVVAPGPQNLS